MAARRRAALLAAALIAPSAAADEHPANQPPFGGEKPPPLVEPDSQTEPPPGFESRGRRCDRPSGGDGRRPRRARRVAGRHPDGVRPRRALAGELPRPRRDRGRPGDPQRPNRRGRRSVARPPGRDEACPRIRRRGRPEGQRPVCLASALRALPGAVLRPQAPAPPRPPGPARAGRPRPLAAVLQPGRDRRLGRAHLPGARLFPGPNAGRRPLAANAPGPADPVLLHARAAGRPHRAARRPDRPQRRRLARRSTSASPGSSAPTGSPAASRCTRGPSRRGSTCAATSTAPPTTSPTCRSSSSFPGTGPGTTSRRPTPLRSPSTCSAPPASSCSAAGCGPATRERHSGSALAFAWAACPWTLYAMNANANDALVAALGIGALLALRSPPLRGAMVALAAAAKFGSAALAPLFATADGERRLALGASGSRVAFVAVGALRAGPLPAGRRRARVLRPHPRLPGDPQLAVLGLGPGPVARLPAARGPGRWRRRSPSASPSAPGSRPRSRSRRSPAR